MSKMTKDYSKFVIDAANRSIDIKEHKKLMVSMKKYGSLKSKPLSVFEKNGKFHIADGGHRFIIAKQLGLPIYYEIEDVPYKIDEINGTQIPWKILTYAKHNSDAGKKDYIILMDFYNQHKLPISKCIALLSGTVRFTNVKEHFLNGEFVIKEKHYAETVASIIEQIYPIYKRAKHNSFIDAICAICRVKDISLSNLIDNIRKHPHLLQSYGTVDSILVMLENIYNFGKRKLYPLAINAKNEMKKRNPTTKNIMKVDCSTCIHEREPAKDNMGICNDCSESDNFKNWASNKK